MNLLAYIRDVRTGGPNPRPDHELPYKTTSYSSVFCFLNSAAAKQRRRPVPILAGM